MDTSVTWPYGVDGKKEENKVGNISIPDAS